jgi:predicted nucleotide-binding protein (sugar kinase/HSP70/actin superfamily)
MELINESTFDSLSQNIGKFHLQKKKVLIPEMNRISACLVAAAFRGFGINAEVLETCKDLDLGKEYTSGKECYPCQVTMGDILYFVRKEKEKLGAAFDPGRYIYFLPESDGPCIFGMYNKYQRIVLDSFAGLEALKIVSLTTHDGYSLKGLIEPEKVPDFRKANYLAVVVADILDRLLLRVRPYETEEGMTDAFIRRSLKEMEVTIEKYGHRGGIAKIIDKLEGIIQEGKSIINRAIPPKPLIGIVGEIFLRMHTGSNQDLIRVLERHGAEVVNASLAEWVNFISYEGLKNAKNRFRFSLKQLNLSDAEIYLKKTIRFGVELFYQEFRQKRIYKRVKKLIDLIEDHRVAHLEKILEEDHAYSFQLGTEACLSIATIIDCARSGYNGMVNVYPFTCMPSMTTSAIVKPRLKKTGTPYLDLSYDSSIQPGREATVRTFMYQAVQHFNRYGNVRANRGSVQRPFNQ